MSWSTSSTVTPRSPIRSTRSPRRAVSALDRPGRRLVQQQQLRLAASAAPPPASAVRQRRGPRPRARVEVAQSHQVEALLRPPAPVDAPPANIAGQAGDALTSSRAGWVCATYHHVLQHRHVPRTAPRSGTCGPTPASPPDERAAGSPAPPMRQISPPLTTGSTPVITLNTWSCRRRWGPIRALICRRSTVKMKVVDRHQARRSAW